MAVHKRPEGYTLMPRRAPLVEAPEVPERVKVIDAGVNAVSLQAKLNALAADDWFPAFAVGNMIVLLRDVVVSEERSDGC